jgi:hypothetical protein
VLNPEKKIFLLEENDEGMSGACPLIMWRWNEEQEDPERVRRSRASAGMPYSVASGPYNSNSVWNLLDAAMEVGTPQRILQRPPSPQRRGSEEVRLRIDESTIARQITGGKM